MKLFIILLAVTVILVLFPKAHAQGYHRSSITYKDNSPLTLNNATKIILPDNGFKVISLPFNFKYYGQFFSSCSIASDGFITFDTITDWSTSSKAGSSLTNVISLQWLDLKPISYDSSSISYSTERTDQFIIQYSSIFPYSYNTGYYGSLTGQIVLYSNFTIELMYHSIVYSEGSSVGYLGLVSPSEEISFTNIYNLLQSAKLISPSAMLSNVFEPVVDCSGELLGSHTIDQCGYCTTFSYQLDCMGRCPNSPNFKESCTEGVADNFGTYFTTVFPYNHNTDTPQLILYISSKDYPSTNVSVYTADNLFKTSLNLTRNSLQTVTLPSSAYLSSSTWNNRKTVIIQSNNEVSVVALNQKQYTTDAYLVLPNSVLGVEYYVAAYRKSFVAITSTRNGNRISFKSPTSYKVLGKTFTASTPFIILLHQHETIQILSDVDMTGGFIQSQYPVSVISGSSCATIEAFCCCDFIGEQMPPTTTLGKEYIVDVFKGRKSDIIRIIAVLPNTVVTYSDGRSSNNIRLAGDFLEFSITSSLAIKSKSPIMVVQYSKSGDFDGTKADPSMLVLSSVDQFLPSFIVTSPSDKPVQFNNYITLYCQTVHTFGVILDGVLTNRTKWTPISGTRFSSYKDIVSSGTHYVKHNSPIVNIGSSLYGFADSDSYAYNAGARFANINANCTVSLAAPGDGVDNDCDGLIDEELCDGIDNDGDGRIDEDCVTDYPKISAVFNSNLTSIDQCTNLERMFNISISITNIDKLCRFSDPVVSSYDSVSWESMGSTNCTGILNRTYSVTDSCGNIGNTLLVKKFSPFYSHSYIPSVVNVQCSKAIIAQPVNISTCSFLPQNIKHFYNDTVLDTKTCSIIRRWYYKDNCNITHHMTDQRIQITGEGPTFVNQDQVGSIIATCDISSLDSLPKPKFKMEGNCGFLTLSSYYYDNIISTSGGRTLCPSKLIRSWVVVDNCNRKFTYQQSIDLQFPSSPVFPANNDQNIDIEAPLIWRSVSSISIYYLHLWSDSELTMFTINSKSSQVSFRPPLKPITIYRWQIFFHDSISNITSAGPVWNFRTKGYADLVVSNLKIYTPTIYTEQYLSFSYVVTNIGTGGGSVLRWYERAFLTSTWIGSFSNLNYLDPGKSYTQYQKVLIPRDFAGNYYLKIAIDYSDINKNNNIAESVEIISIIQSPYPNLAVKAIQNSPSSFSGAETFVRYTVENIGTGATPLGKCWYDIAELYLNGRTTNIRTEYVCLSNILTPQSSYTREFSFEAPNGVFGQGSIILKTNIQSSIFENNELSDNIKNSPIQIILSPTPDLKLVDFSAQTIDIVNREHLISYDIQNIGTGAPFELFWLDALYWRLSNSSSWTLITTTSVRPNSQFEPGNIIHKNVKFILSKDAEGMLDFKVETNYERYILESSGGYDNNVFVAHNSLYVANVYPDLHLYNIVSHVDYVERKIIFNWEVENIGSIMKDYGSIIDKIIITNMITNATSTRYVTNYIKNNVYTGRYELLLADYQEYYLKAEVYSNYRFSVFEAYENRSNNYIDHLTHIDSGVSKFSIKLSNPPKKVDLGRPLVIEMVVSNVGNTTLYTDTKISFQIISETQSTPLVLYTDTLTLSGLSPDNMMKLSRTLDVKCVPNSLNDIMLSVDNLIVDKFSFICRPIYGTFSVSNFTNTWKPKQNALFTSFDVENVGFSMQYADMLSGEILIVSGNDKYSIKTFSTSLKLNSFQSLHFEFSSLINIRLPNGKYNIRLQVDSPLTYQTLSKEQIEINTQEPSLTISKLSVISNSFTIGERINIEYEVSNNSTDLSTIGFYNSWIDTISISSSKYSITDDIKLCWYVRTQPLNAKEYYTMSLECLISDMVSPFDEYYLNLRIITNSISITEKTIGPISISFGNGYPDLSGKIIQVGSSIKNSTDKYFTNEPIHIKYSFANIGKKNISISDSWYDSIYLVSSISDISSSKPLASKLINGPLEVNSTYSNTVLLRIPQYIMGNLFIAVVSDASNMIIEWNRENNILSRNISVVKTTTGSDLIPNNITTTKLETYDGSPVSLMYTVHNIGSEPCDGYLCDNLFVSDIKIGENCYLLDKLLPDKKLSRKLNIAPTPYFGDGNNTLTININAFRSVSEIDYSNNQQSNEITLNSQTYGIGFSKQFSVQKLFRLKVNNKERRVFKIQFESFGKEFQIYLKALSSPSPMDHDTYISLFSIDSSKAIFVENPLLGDYHILVTTEEEQEQNLTISSKYSDIDIDTVYPNIIPAYGNATFMLQGIICYDCPVYLYYYVDGIVLLNTEIRPDQRIWNSERRIYLTFNLKNSTATNQKFALCIWSNNLDRNSCVTSSQTLLNLISNPERGEFSYSVNNPTRILQTTPSYFMDITLKNRGDTDVFVPLFSISGDEQIESISIVQHSENIPLKHKIIMLSDRAMLFPRETRTISFKIKRNLTPDKPLVNTAIVTLTNDLDDRQGFEKLLEFALTSKLFYSNVSNNYIVDKFISFYRQDDFKRELSNAMMVQQSHVYNFYTFINYITNTFFYSSNYEILPLLENRQITIYAQFSSHPEHLFNKGLVGFGWRSNLDCHVVLLTDEYVTISVFSNLVTFKKVSSQLYLSNDNTNNALKMTTNNKLEMKLDNNVYTITRADSSSPWRMTFLTVLPSSYSFNFEYDSFNQLIAINEVGNTIQPICQLRYENNLLTFIQCDNLKVELAYNNQQQLAFLSNIVLEQKTSFNYSTFGLLTEVRDLNENSSIQYNIAMYSPDFSVPYVQSKEICDTVGCQTLFQFQPSSLVHMKSTVSNYTLQQVMDISNETVLYEELNGHVTYGSDDATFDVNGNIYTYGSDIPVSYIQPIDQNGSYSVLNRKSEIIFRVLLTNESTTFVDSNNSWTTYGVKDGLIKTISQNNVTLSKMDHDDKQQLVRTKHLSPSGSVEDIVVYQYDETTGGLLSATLNENQSIMISNSNNTHTTVSTPSGYDIEYIYYSNGLLKSMNYLNSTITYYYNDLGVCIKITKSNATREITIFERNENSTSLDEVSYGNGLKKIVTRNGSSILINYINQSTVVDFVEYVFHNISNQQLKSIRTPLETISLEYNEFNQVSSMKLHNNNTQHNYTYNENGDLIRILTTSENQSVEKSFPNSRSAYQNYNGCAFQYTRADLVKSIHCEKGIHETFEYDALDNLVAIETNETRTEYVRDYLHGNSIIAKIVTSKTSSSIEPSITRYYHQPVETDSLFSAEVHASTFYYQSDIYGSFVGIADENGNSIQRTSYSVFGEKVAQTTTQTGSSFTSFIASNEFGFGGASGAITTSTDFIQNKQNSLRSPSTDTQITARGPSIGETVDLSFKFLKTIDSIANNKIMDDKFGSASRAVGLGVVTKTVSCVSSFGGDSVLKSVVSCTKAIQKIDKCMNSECSKSIPTKYKDAYSKGKLYLNKGIDKAKQSAQSIGTALKKYGASLTGELRNVPRIRWASSLSNSVKSGLNTLSKYGSSLPAFKKASSALSKPISSFLKQGIIGKLSIGLSLYDIYSAFKDKKYGTGIYLAAEMVVLEMCGPCALAKLGYDLLDIGFELIYQKSIWAALKEVLTKFVRSLDPNDILGPEGYGDGHWIGLDPNKDLSYTIRFENDPKLATAPAQVVYVEQYLDDTLFNLGSIRIQSFGWGNGSTSEIMLNNPSVKYQKRILSSEFNIPYHVDVIGGLDVLNKKLIFKFTTIDPETGSIPEDPMTGFLPVNVANTTLGEGFIKYSIRMKDNLATGSVLQVQARIVFDQNPPIDTPKHFNTIDAHAPDISIMSMESVVVGDVISLPFNWSEDGSGIQSFDIIKVASNFNTEKVLSVSILDSFIYVPINLLQPSNNVIELKLLDNVGNQRLVSLSEKLPRIIDCNGNGIPSIEQLTQQSCKCFDGYVGDHCENVEPVRPLIIISDLSTNNTLKMVEDTKKYINAYYECSLPYNSTLLIQIYSQMEDIVCFLINDQPCCSQVCILANITNLDFNSTLQLLNIIPLTVYTKNQHYSSLSQLPYQIITTYNEIEFISTMYIDIEPVADELYSMDIELNDVNTSFITIQEDESFTMSISFRLFDTDGSEVIDHVLLYSPTFFDSSLGQRINDSFVMITPESMNCTTTISFLRNFAGNTSLVVMARSREVRNNITGPYTISSIVVQIIPVTDVPFFTQTSSKNLLTREKFDLFELISLYSNDIDGSEMLSIDMSCNELPLENLITCNKQFIQGNHLVLQYRSTGTLQHLECHLLIPGNFTFNLTGKSVEMDEMTEEVVQKTISIASTIGNISFVHSSLILEEGQDILVLPFNMTTFVNSLLIQVTNSEYIQSNFTVESQSNTEHFDIYSNESILSLGIVHSQYNLIVHLRNEFKYKAPINFQFCLNMTMKGYEQFNIQSCCSISTYKIANGLTVKLNPVRLSTIEHEPVNMNIAIDLEDPDEEIQIVLSNIPNELSLNFSTALSQELVSVTLQDTPYHYSLGFNISNNDTPINMSVKINRLYKSGMYRFDLSIINFERDAIEKYGKSFNSVIDFTSYPKANTPYCKVIESALDILEGNGNLTVPIFLSRLDNDGSENVYLSLMLLHYDYSESIPTYFQGQKLLLSNASTPLVGIDGNVYLILDIPKYYGGIFELQVGCFSVELLEGQVYDRSETFNAGIVKFNIVDVATEPLFNTSTVFIEKQIGTHFNLLEEVGTIAELVDTDGSESLFYNISILPIYVSSPYLIIEPIDLQVDTTKPSSFIVSDKDIKYITIRSFARNDVDLIVKPLTTEKRNLDTFISPLEKLILVRFVDRTPPIVGTIYEPILDLNENTIFASWKDFKEDESILLDKVAFSIDNYGRCDLGQMQSIESSQRFFTLSSFFNISLQSNEISNIMTSNRMSLTIKLANEFNLFTTQCFPLQVNSIKFSTSSEKETLIIFKLIDHDMTIKLSKQTKGSFKLGKPTLNDQNPCLDPVLNCTDISFILTETNSHTERYLFDEPIEFTMNFSYTTYNFSKWYSSSDGSTYRYVPSLYHFENGIWNKTSSSCPEAKKKETLNGNQLSVNICHLTQFTIFLERENKASDNNLILAIVLPIVFVLLLLFACGLVVCIVLLCSKKRRNHMILN